jgi:hypothetical protein
MNLRGYDTNMSCPNLMVLLLNLCGGTQENLAKDTGLETEI